MKHWVVILILLGASACSLRLKAINDPFYEAVLAQNPKNEAALYAQGQVLIREGRFQEAQHYFRRLIRITPQAPEAWLGLGRCLFELHRFKASQTAFGKALDLEPTKDAYLGLASSTLMSGQVSPARDLARKIENKFGSGAVLLKLKGDIEFAARDYAKALLFYRESCQRDPSQVGIGDRLRDLEEFLGSSAHHSNR